jgi:hypothetical protein
LHPRELLGERAPLVEVEEDDDRRYREDDDQEKVEQLRYSLRPQESLKCVRDILSAACKAATGALSN